MFNPLPKALPGSTRGCLREQSCYLCVCLVWDELEAKPRSDSKLLCRRRRAEQGMCEQGMCEQGMCLPSCRALDVQRCPVWIRLWHIPGTVGSRAELLLSAQRCRVPVKPFYLLFKIHRGLTGNPGSWSVTAARAELCKTTPWKSWAFLCLPFPSTISAPFPSTNCGWVELLVLPGSSL